MLNDSGFTRNVNFQGQKTCWAIFSCLNIMLQARRNPPTVFNFLPLKVKLFCVLNIPRSHAHKCTTLQLPDGSKYITCEWSVMHMLQNFSTIWNDDLTMQKCIVGLWYIFT